jgi:DMSO/TMAO reductase YedYZ molybdopterin-dependent catalytic subunit
MYRLLLTGDLLPQQGSTSLQISAQSSSPFCAYSRQELHQLASQHLKLPQLCRPRRRLRPRRIPQADRLNRPLV